MRIKVRMARGGSMELEAEGRVYKDSDGSGQRWTACDDFTLYWPGGGIVADKNVLDISEAEETYVDEVMNRCPY